MTTRSHRRRGRGRSLRQSLMRSTATLMLAETRDVPGMQFGTAATLTTAASRIRRTAYRSSLLFLCMLHACDATNIVHSTAQRLELQHTHLLMHLTNS